MNKFLLVIALLFVTSFQQITPTCQSGFQAYNYICIPQTCLDRDMPKLRKSGSGTVPEGKINPALYLESSIESASVVVKIYQFEYDPAIPLEQSDCIQPVLYTNKGPYFGDHTRTQLDAQNKKPVWPVVTKSYDAASQNTIRKFAITPSDLTSKCVKTTTTTGSDQYTCYFELAFEVSATAQALYFFQIKANVNQDITQALNTSIVPFVEIADAPACVGLPTGNYCTLNAASSLQFCSDQTCTTTSATPPAQLYVNVNFWIIHSITDTNFQTWKMTPGLVKFTSQGTDLTITPISTSNPSSGKIIYQLRAVLAMPQVTITVKSRIAIAAARRQLLEGFLDDMRNLADTGSGTPSSQTATETPVDIAGSGVILSLLAIVLSLLL